MRRRALPRVGRPGGSVVTHAHDRTGRAGLHDGRHRRAERVRRREDPHVASRRDRDGGTRVSRSPTDGYPTPRIGPARTAHSRTDARARTRARAQAHARAHVRTGHPRPVDAQPVRAGRRLGRPRRRLRRNLRAVRACVLIARAAVGRAMPLCAVPCCAWATGSTATRGTGGFDSTAKGERRVRRQ